MPTSEHQCARAIIDVTPIVIQAIRFEMRSVKLTDLTVPQFRTLLYINNNPGASLSAAAEFIGLTLSSMSILVNGLVERGLVDREVSKLDRRRIQLTLSEHGKSSLENVRIGTEDRLATIVSGLTDEERSQVVESLALLRPLFLARALAPDREASVELSEA